MTQVSIDKLRRFGVVGLATICSGAASLMLTTGANAQNATSSAQNPTTGANSQTATTGATSGAAAGGNLELQEVIVTATRQAQGVSVHDVPLTITAVTSEEIQQEGLKRVEDLQREVPGLIISGSNSAAGGGGGTSGSYSSVQVAIRGITSSVSGAAPTTGIYMDDVPLQLRSGGGAGGTALPLLFDLARVEVLKGPQGTLYGGSSEGGTVRFITEQPNFDRPAFATELEGAKTQYGNGSYEYGLSAGAPVVSDVLAFHVSGLFRHDGGYLEHVSQFTGDTLSKDTNEANHEAIHLAADIKITDLITASVSYFWQYEDYSDTDNYWLNTPQYQATTGPGSTYYTYGPYNQFGPFRSGSNTNVGQNFYTSDAQISPVLQPHSQSMDLPSLTLDFHPQWFDLKNVMSYNHTRDYSSFNASGADLVGQAGGQLGPNNQLPGGSPFVANLPVYSSIVNGFSNVGTETEELRISSAPSDSPLTWVGGVFLARNNETSGILLTANFADAKAALGPAGISQNTPPVVNLDVPGMSNEIEKAAFGQVDYLFFDHLKATLGLRYSTDKVSYKDFIGGALFGFPPGLLFPSTTGSLDSHATTPKFGLQYIVDPNTNFYATAAKGYRPGGFNGTLSPQCTASGERLGIISPTSANPSGTFAAFNEDTLWSYELGGKFRPLDGRASINASLFYIDWTKVQTAIGGALVCGTSPAINAGTEVSEGAELEASVVVVPGLTTTLRGAYTNAHYSEGVNVGPVTLINDGDRVPYSPRVQGDLAAEYRFPIGDLKAFVRGDWSYQSNVVTNSGPGTPGYAPDTHTLPSANFGNARVGVDFQNFELSAFVNNISNSEDLLFKGGFAGGPGPVNCANAACTAYRAFEEGGLAATYRPRTIGLDFTYRY